MMNANSARVQMRPPSGGSRSHIRALCALALGGALALLPACNSDGGDDDSSTNANGASAGSAGSSTSTQTPSVAPPSNDPQASANPSQQASTGPGDPRATADAGADSFPHCADSFDDEDGGVSPYLDSCAIDERFGVFVSPNVGPDADADGSRAHPYGTLLHAVAAAVNSGKHVFACEGTYEEPLRIGTALSNGLHVYGGLSCDTFTLASADARSHVHATGDGAALTIADTREVLIERFAFEDAPAADAKPGTSYVGALISNARLVRLRDVELRAASGERGKDGAPPDSAPAGDGTPGDDGGNACSARPNPGGSLATSKGCRMDQNATSGSGGGGGEGTGDGGFGTWYGSPQIPGETSGGTWSCTTAGQGLPYPANPGYAGAPGNGGAGFGALLGTGFIGFGGQNGANGTSGQGGGGGGGARAPSSCAGGGTAVGASGGGGGSGGCGGKGGGGGGSGGQSIGLLMINSNLTIEHATVQYGNGGDGGTGALGQKGGKGAPGGKGGKGSAGSHDACDGGMGADGGDGGSGGGGNGGHAIGVLFAGDAPTLTDVTDADPPDSHHGGKPGTGPIETLMPSVGTPGETHFVFEF